jgi:hypothetical protein
MALDSLVKRGISTSLLVVVACARPSAQKNSASPSVGSREFCSAPAGAIPNAAILGHWLANDARLHRNTFGFQAPDSASVALETDLDRSERAKQAVDLALAKLGARPASARPDSHVLVFRGNGIYAVVDPDQRFCGGGDVGSLPIVFFVDTAWHYLGARSQ